MAADVKLIFGAEAGSFSQIESDLNAQMSKLDGKIKVPVDLVLSDKSQKNIKKSLNALMRGINAGGSKKISSKVVSGKGTKNETKALEQMSTAIAKVGSSAEKTGKVVRRGVKTSSQMTESVQAIIDAEEKEAHQEEKLQKALTRGYNLRTKIEKSQRQMVSRGTSKQSSAYKALSEDVKSVTSLTDDLDKNRIPLSKFNEELSKIETKAAVVTGSLKSVAYAKDEAFGTKISSKTVEAKLNELGKLEFDKGRTGGYKENEQAFVRAANRLENLKNSLDNHNISAKDAGSIYKDIAADIKTATTAMDKYNAANKETERQVSIKKQASDYLRELESLKARQGETPGYENHKRELDAVGQDLRKANDEFETGAIKAEAYAKAVSDAGSKIKQLGQSITDDNALFKSKVKKDRLSSNIETKLKALRNLEKKYTTGEGIEKVATNKGYESQMGEFTEAYKELIALQGSLKDGSSNVADIGQKFEAVKSKIAEATRAMAEFNAEQNNAAKMHKEQETLWNKTSSLESKINAGVDKWKKHSLSQSGYYEELLKLRDNFNGFNAKVREQGTITGEDAQKLSEMSADFARLNGVLGETDNKLGALGKSLKDVLGRFGKDFLIVQGFRLITKAAKDMVSSAIDIDGAMTQLQIVTGATDAEMSNFFEKSATLANNLGKSITDVAGSIEVFSRLGYNLKDSSELAKHANILSNVAKVDTDAATKGLTSIIKGYGMQVEDAQHVADVLIEVGQKYAVSAGELMEAYSRSGAALNATGTSFEKSAGLIAAANAAVQNASTVGTALKTVSARIRSSKTDLDELGESTEDLVGGFAKYREELQQLTGVDIMDELGNFKDLYDIFDEISNTWNKLSDTSQARVSEILGGTRQFQVISSILSNWGDAAGAYQSAMNAAGVELKAHEKYMDSIAGHIGKFKETFSEVSVKIVNSRTIKDVVDLGTHLLKLVGTIGQVVSALGGLKAILGTVIGVSLVRNIDTIIGKFKDLRAAFSLAVEAFKNGHGILSKIKNVFSSMTSGISKAQLITGGIVAGLTAVFGILNAIDAAKQRQIQENLQLYSLNAESANDSLQQFNQLKDNYASALAAYDGGVQSKNALTDATNVLKAALEGEADAANNAGDAIDGASEKELEAAKREAAVAEANARKALVGTLDSLNWSKWSTLKALSKQNFDEKAATDVFTMLYDSDDVKRAEATLDLYEKLVQRQEDLVEEGKTTGSLDDQAFDSAGKVIALLAPYVESLKSAQELISDLNSYSGLSANVDEITTKYEKLFSYFQKLSLYHGNDEAIDIFKNGLGVDQGTIGTDIDRVKNELEELQKIGNVDLVTRIRVEVTDDNKGIVENWGMNSTVGDFMTVASQTYSDGDGVALLVTPILPDGTLLTQNELDSYIDNMLGSGKDYKAFDESHSGILLGVFDEGSEKESIEKAGIIANSIHDLHEELAKLEDADSIKSLANDLNEAGISMEDLLVAWSSMGGGLSTGDIDKTTKSIDSLKVSLGGAKKELEELKEAMAAGEKDDVAKEYGKIYKQFQADWKAGKTGSNAVKAAVELFIPDDVLRDLNYDLEAAGEVLSSGLYKAVFGDKNEDYGLNFINYLKDNLGSEMAGLVDIMPHDDGSFSFAIESFSGLADALGITEGALSATLSALDMYGSEIMITTEETEKFAEALGLEKGSFIDSEAGVRSLINGLNQVGQAANNANYDAFELQALINTLQSAGYISFEGIDATEISNIISEISQGLEETSEGTDINITSNANEVKAEVSSLSDAINSLESKHIKIQIDHIDTYKTTTVGSGETIGENAEGTRNFEGGYSLVNEEGPELISDNGVAYVANGGLPAIVNLSRGAIVLTASETKEALHGTHSLFNWAIPAHKAGLTNRDRILRDNPEFKPIAGTVKRRDSGGGSGGGNGGSGGSGGGNKDKEKSWFEKQYEEHNHLLKMDKESQKDYLKWLDNAYKKAYNEGIIKLEEYHKYEEEVYKGLHDLFKDHLNDREFEIDQLEREEGNSQQIISIYNQLIADIDKEIADARARGLKDDSDLIQELIKAKWGYQDDIKRMEDDSTKDSKGKVKDLVDYRIKMLKQYLKNEKDALKKRLDDLKEFYGKQKDMLQESYDEEKYLDDQKEKRKSVTDIELELDQLKYDDSAWAQKRKHELQEQLESAKKDLDDFEKSHALDAAKDELDKLYEKQEEDINKKIEDLDKKLEDPKGLYEQALKDVQNNSKELYEEMIEFNDKYGSGIKEDIVDMWEEAYVSLKKYHDLYGEYYKDIDLVNATGYVPGTRNPGYAKGTRNATAGIHRVNELGAEYLFKSSNGNTYRMFDGGEKVLSARGTNFLFNLAESGGHILDSIIRAVGTGGVGVSQRKAIIGDIIMGDINISGNADNRTVSQIRRTQRESIEFMLREINKLDK